MKHVVVLLHVSAFFGHIQEGTRQTKIQQWPVMTQMCKRTLIIQIFFFFYWHYNPLWVLSLLSDSLPFCSFFTVLSPPSYSHYYNTNVTTVKKESKSY